MNKEGRTFRFVALVSILSLIVLNEVAPVYLDDTAMAGLKNSLRLLHIMVGHWEMVGT